MVRVCNLIQSIAPRLEKSTEIGRITTFTCSLLNHTEMPVRSFSAIALEKLF